MIEGNINSPQDVVKLQHSKTIERRKLSELVKKLTHQSSIQSAPAPVEPSYLAPVWPTSPTEKVAPTEPDYKSGDIVFVSTSAFPALGTPRIDRGFYRILQQENKTYLDPMDHRGTLEVDLNALKPQLKRVENYQQEAQAKLRETAGWKLHLGFDVTDASKRQQIEGFLQKLQSDRLIKQYKIGRSGGQIGKDITIYIGDKKIAIQVASRIEQSLGALLNEPAGDVLNTNVPFTPKITGRFDAHGDQSFNQYGSQGIPYLYADEEDQTSRTDEEKRARAQKLLEERYGTFYTG